MVVPDGGVGYVQAAAAQARGCPVQVGTDMPFEPISAHLEFFGFGGATPAQPPTSCVPSPRSRPDAAEGLPEAIRFSAMLDPSGAGTSVGLRAAAVWANPNHGTALACSGLSRMRGALMMAIAVERRVM